MANQNEQDTVEKPTAPGSWGLAPGDASAIGNAIADALARNAGPQKVKFGEYVRRRNAGRPTLRCLVLINGNRLDPDGETPETINLLNQITSSGRYFDRKVEVIYGHDGADEAVEIRYANKTVNQRNDLRAYIRSFTDMVQQIVTEQKKEREEARLLSEAIETRRHFGSGKNTEAARAAAVK